MRTYASEFYGMDEDSPKLMVLWTIRFEAAGHSIPVAVRAARLTAQFDLQKAAEDYRSRQGVFVCEPTPGAQ